MDIHSLITSFSYVGIFLLMTVNGVINFPSSQLLYVICGYFISTGSLLFIPTLIAGACGNTLGNTIMYFLVKKYDEPFARKILMLDKVTFSKIHASLHHAFLKKGLFYIFIGKLIPSIKAFIPTLAGLAGTKRNATISIFFVASTIWAGLILSIGYFFGEHASLKTLGGVSLAIGIIVFYFLYKKISYEFQKTVV